MLFLTSKRAQLVDRNFATLKKHIEDLHDRIWNLESKSSATTTGCVEVSKPTRKHPVRKTK